LFYANQMSSRRAFPTACQFLLWHLSQKDLNHIRTWVYHGHNIVKELLMFSESGVDMHARPIQTLLNWLKDYYRPDEGVFRTQDRPISNFVRHISAIIKAFEQKHGADYWTTIAKTSAPVIRYHLYHMVEDDWLTYYLIRIAGNMMPKESTPNSHL
jgi:hypothetical protein